MTQSSLPPIKILFKESYITLKKNFVPFFVFNLLIIAVSIAAFTLIIAGIVLLGIGAGLSSIFANGFNFAALGGAGIIFLFFFILIGLIASVAQIGSIIILYESNPKTSVFTVVKRSAKLIIPIILAGFITGFLVLGGLFLLIVPAIIFSILFTFTYYSIIAENKNPITAIKRSVYLVKNNFIAVLVRLLAIWGLLFLVNIVFGTLMGSTQRGNEGQIVLFQILNLVIQILLTWYSIAYTVTLFKQLQKTSKTGKSSLKLITVLSVIGWALAILIAYSIGFFVAEFISNYQKKDTRQELTPEEIDQLKNIFGDDFEDLNIDLEQYIKEGTKSPEVSPNPASY